MNGFSYLSNKCNASLTCECVVAFSNASRYFEHEYWMYAVLSAATSLAGGGATGDAGEDARSSLTPPPHTHHQCTRTALRHSSSLSSHSVRKDLMKKEEGLPVAVATSEVSSPLPALCGVGLIFIHLHYMPVPCFMHLFLLIYSVNSS